MDVTAQTLRDAEFRLTFRGYDTAEVDDFLEKVAAGIEALQARAHAEADRAARAEARAAQHEARGSTGETDESVRRTLVLAQRAADLVVKEAKSVADRLVADAQQQASAIVADAAREVEATRHEAEAQRAEEQARAGSLVDAAQATADSLVQEAQATADSLVQKAQATADSLLAEARADADRLIAGAEHAAARAEEEAVARLRDELQTLEARHATLAAEVERLQLGVAQTRELADGAHTELQTYFAELLQRLDELDALRRRLPEAAPPVEAAVPVETALPVDAALPVEAAVPVETALAAEWVAPVVWAAPAAPAEGAEPVADDLEPSEAAPPEWDTGDRDPAAWSWSASAVDLEPVDLEPVDLEPAALDTGVSDTAGAPDDPALLVGTPGRPPTAFAVFDLDGLVGSPEVGDPHVGGDEVAPEADGLNAEAADGTSAEADLDATDDAENLDFHVVLRPPEPQRPPLPRFDEEVVVAPKKDRGTLAARLRRARDDDF